MGVPKSSTKETKSMINHPATGVPAFMEPRMSMTVVTLQDPQLLQRAPEDEGFLAILQARRPQDPQGPAGTRRDPQGGGVLWIEL
jgi:hypothetical protein